MNAKDIPRQYSVEKIIWEYKKERTTTEMLNGRAGIYALINRRNNNKYVGHATDLAKRKKEHLSQLMKGKHYNPHLQNSYNLFGLSVFVFVVLEYVPKLPDLNEREQYWIDELKAEYNIIRDVFAGFKSVDHMRFDEMPYIKEGERFIRPCWHAWVYGGARNPALDAPYKHKKWRQR